MILLWLGFNYWFLICGYYVLREVYIEKVNFICYLCRLQMDGFFFKNMEGGDRLKVFGLFIIFDILGGIYYFFLLLGFFSY